MNNARMRNLYLPEELRGAGGGQRTGGSRTPDPNMTLDNAFGVELFWIASCANNCHYCLGHQEHKLLSAGVEEPRITALDCDWSRFTPAEQAAYALARKLTLRPDQLTDDDVAAALKHYKPLQVLEMVVLVSRYNSTNRWTDSLGIPQEGHRDFLTATPVELAEKPSIVVPELHRGPQGCLAGSSSRGVGKGAVHVKRGYRSSMQRPAGKLSPRIWFLIRCRNGCGCWRTSRSPARDKSSPTNWLKRRGRSRPN